MFEIVRRQEWKKKEKSPCIIMGVFEHPGSDLQHSLDQFAAACEAPRVRTSISKSEAMLPCRTLVDCLHSRQGMRPPTTSEGTTHKVFQGLDLEWGDTTDCDNSRRIWAAGGDDVPVKIPERHIKFQIFKNNSRWPVRWKLTSLPCVQHSQRKTSRLRRK